MIDQYRKWRTQGSLQEEGIIIASDHSQEWLLPWWWENYRRWNCYPVTFVDFGMSKEMRMWCQERGSVINLIIWEDFVAGESDMDPFVITTIYDSDDKWCLPYRNAWFKKPLACLQSPYRVSIWIDLDCEILGSLESLFVSYGQSLAMAEDKHHGKASYPIYNSGVIVFQQGIPIVEKWADLSIERNRFFRGDQDVLSWIIHQGKEEVIELPAIYNWSRRCEKNPETVIMHWHGPPGKSCIQHQIIRSNMQLIVEIN